MTFETFSFDRRIAAGIESCGFTAPTPIQSRAIPEVLDGRDVLGLAQTGTGKTAAFALPILQRLLDAKAAGRGPLRVLVLAPTRELALQIQESFVSLGRRTGLRSASVYGGVGINPQVKALRQACIAVACPGRLLDLMNRGMADLSRVDTLVVDEADRMFDMGFLPDLRRIMGKLPAKRQNLFFSATMPDEVKDLFNRELRDPAVIKVAHNAPAIGVSHAMYRVPAKQKQGFLQALLRTTEHKSVLVFTRTKHRAKALARKLEQGGWSAASLQGNLSQNKRQAALDGFKRGRYRIMVATDIAARGIDCDCISHVINYDVPDTADSYTHRIGRTGRAERTGEALTLVGEDERHQMKSIERTLGRTIASKQLDGFDFADAPARETPTGQQERKPSNRNYKGRPNSAPKAKLAGGKGNGSGNGKGKRRSTFGLGDAQPKRKQRPQKQQPSA